MEFPEPRQLTQLGKRVIPVILGAAGRYAYYYYIGCLSGSCPITSNPWISTAYGGVIGLLLPPRRKKERTASTEHDLTHQGDERSK